MKFLFIVLIILVNIFAESNYKEFYENCMTPEHMRKKITEKEIYKPKIPTKQEIEEDEKLEKNLYEIYIIETKTSKTAIIKNKSYCKLTLNLTMFKQEELKDFKQIIEIKPQEEIKLTKIK